MPRMVSFVILLAILLFALVLFVKVMAQFLLPMFLAVILVVMFGPLHDWMVEKCRPYDRVAAALTTLTILLIVLMPIGWILYSAAREGVVLARQIDAERINKEFHQLADQLEPYASTVGFDLSDKPRQAEPLPWRKHEVPPHMPPTGELQQSGGEDDATSGPLPSDEDDEAGSNGNGEEPLSGRRRIINAVQAKVRDWAAPVALGGAQLVIDLLVGLAIMVISLYYFLADGPGMIEHFMRISPLEDRYETELFGEFVRISRAVVVATLLSALVQGLLAGVAYWLADFNLVFLLTALTMTLAMVPFVGSAAVWVPCCVWLWLVEDRLAAALMLLAYGSAVVSMADNVIKPWVLSGRSNLHPLLALLSVLGGVTALGPIGILVGPMLVSFVQALMNLVQEELSEMDSPLEKLAKETAAQTARANGDSDDPSQEESPNTKAEAENSADSGGTDKPEANG